MSSGLGKQLAIGVFFGTGVAIAFAGWDALFGHRKVHVKEHGKAANSSAYASRCGSQEKAYKDCLASGQGSCDVYMRAFEKCKSLAA